MEGTIDFRERLNSLIALNRFPKKDREIISLLFYLSIFMSIGGVVWGSISLFFGMHLASTIPIGFVLVTAINLVFLRISGNFWRFQQIQIGISLIIPFLFQMSLGGFQSSGCVMIWSFFALAASLTCSKKTLIFTWLSLFVILTILIALCDNHFRLYLKPSALPEFSMWFLVLNICAITLSLFFVIMYFMRQLIKARYKLNRNRKELESMNDHLGVVNKEVETKNDQLRKSSTLKSKFLATVSHEIRTPLNGIVGLTDLLASTPLTKDQMDYVEKLQSSNAILLALVNEVLDLSKIEGDKLSLNFCTFNLKKELMQLLELLDLRLQQTYKPINFSCTLDQHLPEFVESDLLRIKQVIINVVNNSIKFTDQGEISVSVTETLRDENSSTVSIRIKDTGVGIPEDKQQELFEEFYRVEEVAIEGTGLGLSITKKLVNLLGGSISLQSQHGLGTEFHIQLPFLITDSPKETSKIEEDLDQTYRDLKVLIAEDNEVNMLVITKMLSNHEFGHVELASNGLEAYKMAKSEHYDVILMDINMPKMSGLEATTKILDHYKNEAYEPIIGALTANAFKKEVNFYKKCGMRFVLKKPFTFTELRNELKVLDLKAPVRS